MARQPKEHRGRTSTATGPFWQLLQDLRQIWAVDPGASQPALRDYPLRRTGGDLR
jgi:hypothetical protein